MADGRLQGEMDHKRQLLRQVEAIVQATISSSTPGQVCYASFEPHKLIHMYICISTKLTNAHMQPRIYKHTYTRKTH